MLIHRGSLVQPAVKLVFATVMPLIRRKSTKCKEWKEKRIKKMHLKGKMHENTLFHLRIAPTDFQTVPGGISSVTVSTP